MMSISIPGGREMRGSGIVIVAVCAVGCGSSFEAARDAGEEAPLGDGGRGEASQDSSADAHTDASGDASTDSGSWSPYCPELEPGVGTKCSMGGVECEYPRTEPTLQYDVACDDVRTCSKATGKWTDGQLLSAKCKNDGPNAGSCPSDYSSAVGGEGCKVPNVWCEYDAAVCVCMPPSGPTTADGGYVWSCNPGGGCPMPRPRLGSTCTIDGQNCTYLTCAYGQQCQDGSWHATVEFCDMPGGGAGH
jgi:hypothetical protein